MHHYALSETLHYTCCSISVATSHAPYFFDRGHSTDASGGGGDGAEVGEGGGGGRRGG